MGFGRGRATGAGPGAVEQVDEDLGRGAGVEAAPGRGGVLGALHHGRPRSRVTARAWAAKASFNSMTSMSASVRPAFASAFFDAGDGPKPMMRGASPAAAIATTRARGFRR